MNIKKVIHWGGPGGMGEPSKFLLGSVISVFSWISKYITWISKQFPHFYAFYWFFMCWLLLVIHFSILQPLSWKVTSSGTQKPTPPTVFNEQVSDWVHCEEEIDAHSDISRHSYKFLFYFLQIFKVVYFAPKNTLISKNSVKFIIDMFF